MLSDYDDYASFHDDNFWINIFQGMKIREDDKIKIKQIWKIMNKDYDN